MLTSHYQIGGLGGRRLSAGPIWGATRESREWWLFSGPNLVIIQLGCSGPFFGFFSLIHSATGGFLGTMAG